MTEELTRIDSAVAGLSISPKDEKTQTKTKTKTVEKEKKHKRAGSTVEGVRNIKDLGQSLPSIHHPCNRSINRSMNLEKDQIPIEIAIETQKTGWYVPFLP